MGFSVSERTARSNSGLVKVAASVMVALLVSLLMVSSALADRIQPIGADSVDTSGFYADPTFFPPEVRYEILTDNYRSVARWGIDEWNRLRPVCIVRDTAYSIRDLAFTSNNYGDVLWVGQWQQHEYGSDIIRFNSYRMERASYNNYYGVGVHEMGHAIGLGHPSDENDNAYLADYSIMYYKQSGLITWRSFDRESYNRRWQNYYHPDQIC